MAGRGHESGIVRGRHPNYASKSGLTEEGAMFEVNRSRAWGLAVAFT